MHTVQITPGGQRLGTDHIRAKMNYEKAAEIRRLRQGHGLTYRALGAMFGIDHKTARSIALGMTWAPAQIVVVSVADDSDLEQVRQMVESGIGIKKIAKQMGVADSSVRLLMRRHGLASKNKSIRLLHAEAT